MGECPKWTDVAIVILTIGIVFFAFMQWLEIRGAGKQTDQLVDYAESIAPQASYHQSIGNSTQAEPENAGENIAQVVADYPFLKNRQLFLYYNGIVKYADNSWNHHETQYCRYLANPDTKEAGFVTPSTI